MKTELPVPEIIDASERAMEMARIWIADGSQYVVLSPDLWKDPGAWGWWIWLVTFQGHTPSEDWTRRPLFPE